MKAHVNSGRDTPSGHDFAFVNPADALPYEHVTEPGPKVRDVFPVRRSGSALKEACFGEYECTRTDRGGDRSFAGTTTDPLDHPVIAHLFGHDAIWYNEQIRSGTVLEREVGHDVQPSASAHDTFGPCRCDHAERLI